MAHLQYKVLSHSQKVCRLYKKALYTIRDWQLERWKFRYEAVLLRARFDENKEEKDLRKARILMEEGEVEWFKKRHPQPMMYAHSPGGICYGRFMWWDDHHLDDWHPLEKAIYPQYFKRREERKREYFQYYAEKYGKEIPPPPKEYFEITEDKIEVLDGFFQDKIEYMPGKYKSAIKGTINEKEPPHVH